MSASIKDNILFSHKYDEVFYTLVLDGTCRGSRWLPPALFTFHPIACALRPDLALMADGDMTEVGEKGG